MFQRKKRVLTAIAVILLFGMLGTSFASFLVSREAIRNQLTDSTLPLVGNTIYSEIQRDLLRPVFISSVMASNTFVHDWVASGERNINDMSRYLGKIQAEYEAFTVFFASEKTRNYYHPTGLLQTMSAADPKDGWYFRFREKGADFELNVDQDAANQNKLAVFVNFRMLDRQGKFIGAIGVGLAIESVSEIIQNYSKTFNRVIYFVDKAGHIQLGSEPHGNASRIQDVEGLSQLSKEILDGGQQAKNYFNGEDKVFLNSRYIEELDWFLMVEQREQAMLAPIFHTLLYNLLTSLAIALLVLGLAHRVLFPYHRDLENRAHLDGLTGAYNRRAFEAFASDAMVASERKQQPLSMMFVDIDHFKSINDKHGHLVGDLAIKHVVETLKKNIRASDYICRWGGEEFCILLRQCGSRESYQVAQVALQAVAEQPLVLDDLNLDITVSIGVAQRHNKESFTGLLQRIDDALYRAKNSGRNQVKLAEDGVRSATSAVTNKQIAMLD